MLKLSSNAKEKLGTILNTHKVEPEKTIRVVKSTAEDSDLEFVWDKEQENDQVIKNDDGRTVLVVKSDLAQSLDGMTLHYRETPEGAGFMLKRESSEA